jgi:hypothetical protein
MTFPLCHAALAAVLVAASSGAVPSAYAQGVPRIESSAPGVSRSRPAPIPPPSKPAPSAAELAPANGASGVDESAPPFEARKETLKDGMSFWDPGTHMSKSEWLATCKRTYNGRLF